MKKVYSLFKNNPPRLMDTELKRNFLDAFFQGFSKSVNGKLYLCSGHNKRNITKKNKPLLFSISISFTSQFIYCEIHRKKCVVII